MAVPGGWLRVQIEWTAAHCMVNGWTNGADGQAAGVLAKIPCGAGDMQGFRGFGRMRSKSVSRRTDEVCTTTFTRRKMGHCQGILGLPDAQEGQG
jgi:hypothetical protein